MGVSKECWGERLYIRVSSDLALMRIIIVK